MEMKNLKNPLERKHLLSKLFLVISLSLISVFQTEAQYTIEIEIEEERLQESIKRDNPNLERIREIIEQKPWIVFAMDKYGNTPLHDTARYGHLDVATLLLDRGANVESKTKDSYTALHRAARNGHLDVVTLLLDRGANVESKTKHGYTALHDAARYGRINVATLLLDRGADVESKDKYGFTALHNAAWYGHLDVANLLLDRGANVESRTNTGKTPFQLAKNQEIRDLLVERGAKDDCKGLLGFFECLF